MIVMVITTTNSTLHMTVELQSQSQSSCIQSSQSSRARARASLETSFHYLHGLAAVSRAKKPRVATPSPQTARGSEAGKEGVAS